MPFPRRTDLPDPDAARRTISETVPELGRDIARQARAHATAVLPFLDRKGLRGPAEQNKARRLITELIGDWYERGGYDSWMARMHFAYAEFYPLEDPNRFDPGGFEAMLEPARKHMHHKPDFWLAHDASVSDLRALLEDLHRGLITVADTLVRSIPRPPLLPEKHPPTFARLHDAVVAETVAENLAALIDEGLSQYRAVLKGGGPGSDRSLTLGERFSNALKAFLTHEVWQRYDAATHGFEFLTRRMREGHDERDSPRSKAIHQRLFASYAAIGINYLAEVLDLMPNYAEASGQGPRRDPITVYGNVGAIGEVNNSNVTVAHVVSDIGMSAKAIADRGDTGIATAVRALAEAVQQDRQLTEDVRAQLLDHVADVADAAAAPDEPRRLSRARAALAAITEAAGASTRLTQAVSDWHHVAGQLF
ncbi:hypothetical protein [Streptomyces sp. NPDC001675]